ncbi:hypothetical protein BAY60_25435 [Prauserella muralis]|uniref:Uncharacterized protein n=1 Tax=Prauserella muralis TaxID=588067 RepID=A0A2V4AY47_9PSEU|nr:hypothetical protein BAY60_25435 [Prauserella muralis]
MPTAAVEAARAQFQFVDEATRYCVDRALGAAAPHVRAAEDEAEAERAERLAADYRATASTLSGRHDFLDGYLTALEDFAEGLRKRAEEYREAARG